MSEDGIEGISELPIKRSESDAAAVEFLKHWSPGKLAKHGLHAVVKENFYQLQDHGDIIILTVSEGHAISEWLCTEGNIGLDVFEDNCKLSDELKSAVKKLLFANGRCFGMTNSDMGIEEEDGQG